MALNQLVPTELIVFTVYACRFEIWFVSKKKVCVLNILLIFSFFLLKKVTIFETHQLNPVQPVSCQHHQYSMNQTGACLWYWHNFTKGVLLLLDFLWNQLWQCFACGASSSGGLANYKNKKSIKVWVVFEFQHFAECQEQSYPHVGNDDIFAAPSDRSLNRKKKL